MTLIERYNAAWNDHDLAAISALHAPDVVFETRRFYDGPEHAVCESTAIARKDVYSDSVTILRAPR